MNREFWHGLVIYGMWGLGGLWSMRVADLVKSLPGMPDLSQPEWDVRPEGSPRLVVVVPGRDEAANIAATMDALVAADYWNLQIVAVDDRSVDATGELMDGYAARHPERVKVIHVTEQEDGWMGKTFAMQLAVEQTESDYILFTDADVLFSPSILRRAVAYAEQERADHLVVMPTMLVKGRGEGITLGFFQILGMWAARPWKVGDVKSRDSVGVGACNMVRRDALMAIGGLEPQRMVVLEDVTLGRRMKAAGLAQRVVFAPGLVLVHWAKGARGIVRVMTKNMFSAVNFNPLLMLGMVSWIVMFCLVPLAGLVWIWTLLPSLLVLVCIAAAYRAMARFSWIDARYGWLYPAGAVIFAWAMVRSMVVGYLIGGVRWRGTKYSMSELRRHNSPWQWGRLAQALKAKEEADLLRR